MINITENQKLNHDTVLFEHALEQVKCEVDRALSTSPFIIREYTKHLASSMGKYIRAISLLTCSQDQEGNVPKDAIKFAASIEILHLATLVHDDVMDNADLRRGEVTLQKKYGKRTAVICGDYLLCMALNLSASIPNKKDYLEFDMPDYMSKVCLGELNQHINNGNFDLSIFQYLKIISGKTAALFEASFYGGALLTETNQDNLRKYARLGKYIGMIFQLTDDCMDFESTEQEAKKPVQSDYEQNVFTLPLIYAFKKIASFKQKAQISELSREEINNAVCKAGGLLYTRRVAKKYYEKSLVLIENLEATEDKKIKLKLILEKAFRIH